MDTPLVQPSTEVSNYVDNSVAIHRVGSFELTAAIDEAIREDVEALLQSNALVSLNQVQRYHHIVEFLGGSVIAGEIPSLTIYRI